MSQATWYQTGKEGFETAQKKIEESRSQYGPMRFWLKQGGSAKITFLDSEGFYFSEHNLKINGKWGNYFTCTKDFSECPLCEAGERPGYMCAYTIIDHSEYETKQGRKIKNQKKLLVVRPQVMNKLARRREALEGNLQYALFRFSRDGAQECSTGEDIEYVKRLSKADLVKFKPADCHMTDEEWLKPFDYMTLFAPKSVDELRKISGQAAPVGADNFQGQTQAKGKAAESVDEQSIDDLL